mgnify:CR=1 FL=1
MNYWIFKQFLGVGICSSGSSRLYTYQGLRACFCRQLFPRKCSHLRYEQCMQKIFLVIVRYGSNKVFSNLRGLSGYRPL